MFFRLLISTFAVLLFWCRLNSSSCNYLYYQNSTYTIGHCTGVSFGIYAFSNMAKCSASGSSVTFTQYSNANCSGANTTETLTSKNATFMCGGSDCYASGTFKVYNSSTYCSTGYVGYEIISEPVGICIDGRKFTCTSSSVTGTKYSAKDCSGSVISQQTYDNTCRSINNTKTYAKVSGLTCNSVTSSAYTTSGFEMKWISFFILFYFVVDCFCLYN